MRSTAKQPFTIFRSRHTDQKTADRGNHSHLAPCPCVVFTLGQAGRFRYPAVCFGALALSQVTGILPDTGALIYGEGYRRKTVKIADHFARTRQIVEAIEASRQDQKPPPLVLNEHCAVCDFQSRCRNLAIERDDLSLLSAMTGKERTKCNAKGISTITQLSYGYRPRRRKRTKPDAEDSTKSTRRAASVVKNDHKLKALAIKKNQIHVVGAPSLKFTGVPIFLDVEGMPDRDFYYLVGLRFESGGEQVEHSFWADGLDGERVIWENCLQTLKAIGNAQIVSYGAYETRYLKQMRERYVLAPDDVRICRSPHRNVGQSRRLHLRQGLLPDIFEQPQGSRPIPRVRVGLATGFRRCDATTAASLGARRRRRAQARTDRLQHGRLPSDRDGRGRSGAHMRRRRLRPRCGRCRFAGCRFPTHLGQTRLRPAGVREDQQRGVLGLST